MGRIAGVIVLITGLYVAYYGYYEIRLYFTRAETDDPVIQAASTLQDSLIRLVDGLSPWLLLGVAAALVAVAVGWHTLARRRASNPAAQSLPDPTS
ncbi:putative integral membrane transporter domain protein [Mycobacterium ulcerans str. Harvey]|uniref:Integral membrane transporter domain protein n=1 Tax=Mycobacterium ulcerans str. Harvey TaxID=1299332 RepID=A0ABN0QQC3_MYCUL|nr:putative integral membrane transporter domain protein [Mycobacterium ulcerans str. Harvey]